MVIATRDNPVADYIAMVTIVLMAVGAVFVFSAGVSVSREFSLQRFYELPYLRQILFFLLAVIIMYGVSFFDYRRLSSTGSLVKSPVSYLLVLSITLLILVLFPQLGTEINQARRWFRIGVGPVTISFQPSELAKWSLVFFLAWFCDKFRNSLKSYWRCFIPLCAVVGLVVGLIITEDFGTAVFIAFLAFLMLIVAGVKFWHILTLFPFGAVGFFAVLVRSPGRIQRIYAFLNPEKWADSAAYQASQSLIALGSGGLLGKGLGKGICKYGHLPEDTTDFIFAIIGEELGFVGTAAVIGLFVVFVWLGVIVVVRCGDHFGRLLAGGIVLTIATQAVINIGVVTVVLPTKGIPLPFVSAGGTSMLLSAAAVGVLLNIAKQSNKNELVDIEE